MLGPDVMAGILRHGAAYVMTARERYRQICVGLQTDKPLKRAFMPYGGIKMAEKSCEMYGYKPNPQLHEIFPNTIKHITRGI